MAIVDELVGILEYRMKGEADLKKFQSGMANLEKSAIALGATLGKVAAVAGAAVAGGFGLLGKSVISTAAQFETFTATLETIEGSADKAKASLDWISKFARTTPYEVAELTSAFVKLKAYGIEPMDGTMTVLGDTASAMGKSLNEAVEAFADAGTGEFERLKEFGITSKTAGEKVTFSWKKNGQEMSRTVKKSGGEIQKFLKDTWGANFGGAMEKRQKTWTAMMSNLKDSWTDFMRRIADSGFFETVKRRLESILEALERWNQDGTIDGAAKTLGNAFTWAADALGVVAERIVRHVKFLNENWEKYGGTVRGVGAALILLLARAHPLIAVLGFLAAVVEDVLTYFQGGVSITGKFIEKIKELNEYFLQFDKAIGEALVALKEWIEALDQYLASIADRFVAAGRQMGISLLDGLKSMGQEIKDWFLDLIPDWAKPYLGVTKTGGGAGGGGASGGTGNKGIRARAGRSSAGYQGRVPLNSAEAGELKEAIQKAAAETGASPEDLATLVSFETGGTFNKNKEGGRRGRHKGYIQWGPTERAQYGIRDDMTPSEQMAKAAEFLKDRGYRPGMSGEQLYATVNAGSPYKTGASDARNGGTWGTAADKWRYQMAGHRANARKLLAVSGPAVASGAGGDAVARYNAARDRMDQGSGSISADSGYANNQNVTVQAPVNINVKQATDAPGAIKGAVGRAVQAGAAVQPSRMQSGPAR
jgi:hypothetical protein